MNQEIQQFKRYIEHRYPDRSTSKHYMSDLAIFSQFISPKAVAEIGGKEIDEFVQAQSDQGMKGTTINRRLSTISSFYEYVIGSGGNESLKNPVVWKRHSIRMGHHLPRDVSDEAVNKLLQSVADERDRLPFPSRAVFSLFYYCSQSSNPRSRQVLVSEIGPTSHV